MTLQDVLNNLQRAMDHSIEAMRDMGDSARMDAAVEAWDELRPVRVALDAFAAKHDLKRFEE